MKVSKNSNIRSFKGTVSGLFTVQINIKIRLVRREKVDGSLLNSANQDAMRQHQNHCPENEGIRFE